MDELRFEPTAHEYYYGTSRVPSVTQIIREAGFGPMMPSVDPYAGVDPEVLARASARGTAVHEDCAEIDRGNEIDLSVLTVDYVAAYEKWTRLAGYEPIDTEVRIYHPHYGYAGTLDMVGWIGNNRVIGDRKTENAFKPSAFAQVEAYRRAWNYMHPNDPASRSGVLILRAGKDPVWKWNERQDEAFVYFLAALARHHEERQRLSGV